MSLEAFGDSDEYGDAHAGYVTEERAEEAFVAGAQAMREILARFVEASGYASTARSMRANWHPDWGKDPGAPETIADGPWNT